MQYCVSLQTDHVDEWRMHNIWSMEELDKLLAAQLEMVEGFPLKSVAVSTTTGQKGKRQSVVRTETVVTELQETAVPADTFEIPAGYTRTEMMEGR